MLVGGISWGNLVSGGRVCLYCTALYWSGVEGVLCCAVLCSGVCAGEV